MVGASHRPHTSPKHITYSVHIGDSRDSWSFFLDRGSPDEAVPLSSSLGFARHVIDEWLRGIVRPSLHKKHTLNQFYNLKMNTFKAKPKKSTLGQFHPETPMRGPAVGYAAMACVVGSFVLNSLWGWVAGVLLASAAVVLGKIGLDSEGRGVALVSLILGVVLIGVILTVLIVGSENIGINST